MFLDTSSTYLGLYVVVRPPLFRISILRPWDLTKRRDDIGVPNMVADMATNMDLHMVADMEVDKVAVMVADMFSDIVTKLGVPNLTRRRMVPIFSSSCQIGYPQFGDRVGHGGWLIGPKLFRPENYPTCVSSKLREFIQYFSRL